MSKSKEAKGAVHGQSDLVFRSMSMRDMSEDERKVSFVMSTEDRDGHGEVVKQDWDLKRFKSNPVFLWAHNSHELPIGKVENARVEDGKLQGDVVFASSEMNPKAEQVYQLYKNGFLRGCSVGFKPGKIAVEEENEVRTPVLSNNELFELSAAPVPSNPNALNELIMRMYDNSMDGTIPLHTFTYVEGSHAAECGATEEDMNIKEMETALAERDKLLEDEKAKTAVLEERCSKLEEKNSELRSKVTEHESTMIRNELDSLIGKKITADEVNGLVKVANIDRELYDAQLKSIKARPDMQIVTENSVVGEGPSALPASESLNDRVNAQ